MESLSWRAWGRLRAALAMYVGASVDRWRFCRFVLAQARVS